MASAVVAQRAAWRRWLSEATLLVAVLGVYVTGPNVTNSDSYLAFPTAVSIVHELDLDLDEFRSSEVRSHHGFMRLGNNHYDRYPWPVALFFVPTVAIVDIAHALGIGPGSVGLVESDQMGAIQMVIASAVTALVAVVVYRLVLARLGDAFGTVRRMALATALGFAFATPAWSIASRALWQHGPAMLFLGLALVAAVGLGRRPESARTAGLFGASLAAAYVVRPSSAVAVVVFSLWVLVQHRRQAFAFLAGAATIAIPWFVVNIAAYGLLFPPYYSAGRISLHSDFLEAVLANLVSPARGVFLFSPILLLALVGIVVRLRSRQFDGLDIAVATAVVVYLLMNSAQNEGWWAGHTFGPRFMTDPVPLLVFLAIPAVAALWRWVGADGPSGLVRLGALACGLALVWSVAVHAQGAYFRAVNCWNIEPTDVNHDPDRVWSLSDPQFVAGYRAAARVGVRSAMLGPCPLPGTNADR